MAELIYRIPGVGIFTFLLLFQLNVEAEAQLRYGLSSTVYGGPEGNLPFWFYSNSDGVVDPSSANLVNGFYAYVTERDTANDLRLTGGFDVHGRLAADNTLVFTQLFGKASYRGIRITAGRFYDPVGLNDDDLSMGSMLISRNATPVPKIQVGSDGFVRVPETGGRLRFKAMISHGWFTDNRYIDDSYLHQKFFYLKYNHNRFDVTAGMAHNTMWGGTHPGFGGGPFDLPSSLSDYFKVVFGRSASGDNVPVNEITNAVGNSVAAYEVKLGLNFDHFRLKAYRLFYLEDKVALRFRSPWDGLWGAGIELDGKQRIVTELLWEHMNTKRQNAWIDTPLGRNNYYNNGVYRSGWTYEEAVLGNPLLIYGPTSDFDGGPYPISNNIIIAHHIGFQGKPASRLSYKLFLTYSRNYGTYVDQGAGPPYTPLDEIRADEYSSLLQLEYQVVPAHGLSLTGAFAFDTGALYEEDRLGLLIGVSWDRVAD